MTKKILTLCIVHQKPRILLGMKKRGFGVGKWNGFGGKVQENETIEEAAIREVKEEAGIDVDNLIKHGIIEFEFQGNPEILEIHLFRAHAFAGIPAESEEMKPRWFTESSLPYDEMWADDRHWMPLFLEGKMFRGKFLFQGHEHILDWSLEEVGALP